MKILDVNYVKTRKSEHRSTIKPSAKQRGGSWVSRFRPGAKFLHNIVRMGDIYDTGRFCGASTVREEHGET